jgi:hypothetical protein
MNSPLNLVDLTGEDWFEFTDIDGNSQTMWRNSRDKTYTDNSGNEWRNIGENYLSINGNQATLYQQKTNDNGSLYLTSSSYNLTGEESNKSLTATVDDLLSTGSSVAGAVGILGESSNATFRLTNSKGKLDFKFYGNGWKGNQWVTPSAFSKVGTSIKWGGNALSLASAYLSVRQISSNNTTLQNVEHGVDGAMSLIGMYNTYTFAASLYYQHVMKNYSRIKQSVNQQLIDRANMIKKGFIPVGHPGFPFK